MEQRPSQGNSAPDPAMMPDPETTTALGPAVLEMFGLSHLADRPLLSADGQPMTHPDVEGPLMNGHFLHICGPHVLPAINNLLEMGPDHPDYQEQYKALSDGMSRIVKHEPFTDNG